jgi:hypothetical protein
LLNKMMMEVESPPHVSYVDTIYVSRVFAF